MKRKSLIEPVYLTLALIIMYLPILIVVVYSFNASKNSSSWDGFTLDWYGRMLRNNGLMESLKNSVIVAVLSCVISAVIGTIGAVGMSRASFRAKGIFEGVSTIPIMVPEIILGMAFLAFFSLLNLPFGMLTIVLSHITFCIPYIFLIVKSRLADIDKSIGEAARDLGASGARMFFDITLPLIAPGIISGTLLAFAMSMDDVVISFFTTGPGINTLPIKIYSQLKVGITPEINALCTVILGVTFVIIGATRIVSKK